MKCTRCMKLHFILIGRTLSDKKRIFYGLKVSSHAFSVELPHQSSAFTSAF